MSALGRLLSRLDRPKFGTMLEEAMSAVKKDSADKDGLATFGKPNAEFRPRKIVWKRSRGKRWTTAGLTSSRSFPGVRRWQ